MTKGDSMPILGEAAAFYTHASCKISPTTLQL